MRLFHKYFKVPVTVKNKMARVKMDILVRDKQN